MEKSLFDVWTNKFAENIFKQKYSRDGQESWSDTCNRVVGAVCRQYLSSEEQEIIYNYMVDRKFIPGGRYLYAAGRPFHQVNNCHSGSTRIITKQGIKSLKEVCGHQVEIRNKFGRWENGTVQSFGKQLLFKITFEDGRMELATANHRWWQEDGSRITTSELKKVPYAVSQDITELDQEGIRHGFMFGDGQLDTKTAKYSYVVIPTKKKEEMARFFNEEEREITVGFGAKVKHKTHRRIKAGLKVSLQPAHYKKLPSKNVTPEYARGFIAGLIASDGSTRTLDVTISCEGYQTAQRIAELAVLGGCTVTRVDVIDRKNPFNGKVRELSEVTIWRDTAPIVRTDQLEDVSVKPIIRRNKKSLKVVSIEPSHIDEVYCVVAPESESFTLANGLITSNCFLFRAEDSREGWADVMQKITSALMTGGGIGIDYSLLRGKGAKIHKTGGESTGPLALMHMVNEAGRYIMQGGARRCLPEDSYVHTQRGLVKISEVVPGQDFALTSKGYRRILNKFVQGKQKTVKIKTQTGVFECTPNHRMAVLSSVTGDYVWKEARNLQENDRLMFTAEVTEGVKTKLPPSNYVKSPMAYTAKDLTIPELDTDLAWFFGYFHGNGFATLIDDEGVGKRHGRVNTAVPHDAPQVAVKIVEQISRFGVAAKIKQGDGCKNVNCSSVGLATYFTTYVKRAKEEIVVPTWILQARPDIRAAYVAGMMDADGSVASRPICLLTSVYPEFCKQMQALCASLGFATRLFLTRKARGNWKNLYKINITNSKQEATFYNTVGQYLIYKKEDRRVRQSEQCSYSFSPDMVRSNLVCKKSKVLHKNYRQDFSCEKVESVIGRQWFTPVRVFEMLEGRDVETFDIEVEEDHEFFCNGFLTHNSAIWAGLSWQHPDIKDFIHIKNWSDDIRKLKEKDFNFPAPMEGTNISVVYDTEFFIAIEDRKHPLHKLAKEIWQINCLQAFRTAEPGMSFNFLKDNESLRNAPVHGETYVLTNRGNVRVKDVVGKEIEVWTGQRWAKTVFKKTRADDSILKLTFENGSVLRCSYDHPIITEGWERIEARDLTASHNILTVDGSLTTVLIDTEEDGEADVYCCDVGVEEHSFAAEGILVSNCTEVVSEDDSDKCNLGTIWMNRFTDREDFAKCIKYATKFLVCGGLYSDVPTEKIREVGLKNNRIGLGLGGMHEWLMQRGEGYEVTPEMHKWLSVYEMESDASAFITARELGVSKPKGVRAIAPTGTIGIIAETTTGIEPLFCKAYKRRYLKGEKWHYEFVVDAAVKRLMEAGVKVENIIDAYDISFKDRVKFQADVQNYVDMSISSTCNLPQWGSESNNEQTVEQDSKMLLKYAKRLRGFTCYPDGARGGQPLTRVELDEALSQEGVVFEEKEHECVGGVCGV